MSPFFPDMSGDADYISADMACLTTLPAFATMIWCGWQRGLPARALVIRPTCRGDDISGVRPAEHLCIHEPGPPTEAVPEPCGPVPGLDSGQLVVATLFVCLALMTLLWRRLARPDETGSAA